MSLPRLPPRGNPTPTVSAEMSYAQRQQARAALSALMPAAGQTLNAFTDTWTSTMREAGFDSREIAAAKAVFVRLVDLGAEFPTAVAAVTKPVATPPPVAQRRDPRAPVIITTELHPSDEHDPDYAAAIATPEPVDPYDDEDNSPVVEPPELAEQTPPAVEPAPVVAAAATRLANTYGAPPTDAPVRPQPRLQRNFSRPTTGGAVAAKMPEPTPPTPAPSAPQPQPRVEPPKPDSDADLDPAVVEAREIKARLVRNFKRPKGGAQG